MKYRLDMVTNSSSSSFVCQLQTCGCIESGWDLCLSEAEMIQCENDHTICECEIFQPTQEDYKQYLIKYYNDCINSEYSDQNEIDNYKNEVKDINSNEDYDFGGEAFDNEFRYQVPEQLCPICSFVEYLQSDLKQYLQKEYNISEEEVFNEEIKVFADPRKTSVYELEYIFYVCQKFDLTPAYIVSRWKERFKTYNEFMNYINQ